MKGITKFRFEKENYLSEGTAFLLTNGHVGYRGTYEEYGKEKNVALNIVGVYDQYEGKWRESVNLPNPFLLRLFYKGEEISLRTKKPLHHKVSLDFEKALWKRETEFAPFILKSTRFVSVSDKTLLGEKIVVEAKRDLALDLFYGLDRDIYDINGPHFKEKTFQNENGVVSFFGETNEGTLLRMEASYSLDGKKGKALDCLTFKETINLEKGKKATLYILANVLEKNEKKPAKVFYSLKKRYERELKLHSISFFQRYMDSLPKIRGEGSCVPLPYDIFELVMLGDSTYARSIPARGASGQTYKGAIFWDSEIFMLPFYALTDPSTAHSLLSYRIKTLAGAKKKAKEFGYKGAFYAWESQEDGIERCSKFNVTDPITGEKIRTYFNEKQIHISADIAYALDRYIRLSGDKKILEEGGKELLKEVADFYLSYAKDVIGPDEYHERVDDNAFTNYMAAHALSLAIRYKAREDVASYERFLSKLYLPKPNANGVIEQFEGYFKKEDVSLSELRSRLRDPRDYWGGPKGIATPTQVIKQADVVALLALLPDLFPLSVKKANYLYYFPRTEHGSSLSASMYALLGSEIGELETAYDFFSKSASTDLVKPKKEFAGGVYIGGSHVASYGGTYLSLVYGFAGLSLSKNGKIAFFPHLPKEISSLSIPYFEKGKKKVVTIKRGGSILMEEK